MKSLVCVALFGLLGALFGQSASKSTSEPKFSELSHAERERLNRQRAVVAAVAKEKYGIALTRTTSDLPILQKLLDDQAFKKAQTYELQSLGVAFGDVLTSELPLRWVMITDRYGTDPTLRFKSKEVNVNVLTMISKRIKKEEAINLLELLRMTREQLSAVREKSR